MLIHNISQLLQMTPQPQKGAVLGTLGVIRDAAVLIRGEKIEATGLASDLLQRYPDEPKLDAGGGVVMPGLVDPHTHLIFAGDRVAEFEMRLQGRSYMDIMAAGGGITATVDATRLASVEDLIKSGRARAKRMLEYGTTTAEAKTGYGLNTDTETRMLEAIFKLDLLGPLELVPTFLGAHALPKEYGTRSFAYTMLVSTEMLEKIKAIWKQSTGSRPLPFVDVFCEPTAFDLAHSRKILEAAKALGFPLKIHTDEFENIGGTKMAASLGAVSADHLVKTKPDDFRALAAAGTVAVSLPCTPFGLGESHYTPADEAINAGCILALATDLNPGTAWCESMQFVIALACRYMKLTPAQAIAASTINAAAAISRQDLIGSITPGKQADLIVLDTTDYRHLGYRFGTNLVKMVIKRGKKVVG